MNVNGSALSAIFRNLSAAYNNAFEAAPSTYAEIAMTVPSSGKYVDYHWLARFPKMELWVGTKNIEKLTDYKYVIVNESFAATVEVMRDDIEDDQLGIYKTQAEGAAFSAKQLPDELTYAAVNKVFTANCYDGTPMVCANHPVAGAVVSNVTDKKLSAETQAKAKASFGAAYTAMCKMKDEKGRPLNVKPNILLVSPALEDVATALMTSDRLDDGKANLYKGKCKVVVDARLTNDDAWFLLDTTKPVKPFVLQVRKKPVFVQMTNPDSANVFLEGVYYYGAEARMAAGYGHWQLIFGSTGTTAP